MDENKHKRLQEVKWRTVSTCGTCLHGQFPGTSDFGTCKALSYFHLKHQREHPMPAHRSAVCDQWEHNGIYDGLATWLYKAP